MEYTAFPTQRLGTVSTIISPQAFGSESCDESCQLGLKCRPSTDVARNGWYIAFAGSFRQSIQETAIVPSGAAEIQDRN